MRTWLAVATGAAILVSACSSGEPSSERRPIPIEPVSAAPTEPSEVDGTEPTSSTSAPPRGLSDSAEPEESTIAITDLRFELSEYGSFEQPLDMAVRQGDGAIYIAEKTGRVRRVLDGVSDVMPFLDLSDRVSTNGERGLLGIAFTPGGDRFVASYTDRQGDSVVASWPATTSIDLAGEVTHLVVGQPFGNHNGGDIAYGPDGHLYVALGDGGSGGDPLDSGQDTTTVLGAILRIDLTADGYAAVPGNPLSAPDRPELWLWGLRNPWRFSFDRATGDLWIGDVGQGDLEEIDVVAPDPDVRNLGWNRYEGTERFTGAELERHLAPLVEYRRSAGVSVTGGYVYRGEAQPHLDGVYFYADFVAGWIRALRYDGETVIEHAEVLDDISSIAAFGEDHAGEIYVLTLGGTVYRIVAEPAG